MNEFTEGKFKPRFVKAQVGGLIFFLVEQDYISAELRQKGVWEEHLYKAAEILLNQQSNVLDLGANFGYHALRLSQICSLGQVYAFEPLNICFSQLQMNIVANKIRNVIAYKFAVTDKSGYPMAMSSLEENVYGDGKINIGNSALGSGGDVCFSLRIDDLDLPRIDLIKMDIQGAEYLALQGMQELIKRDRPYFFVEIEEPHLLRFGTSSKQVIEHFFQLDYSLVRIRNQWPTDHVAIPNEKKDIVDLLVTKSGLDTDVLSGSRITLEFDNPSYYSSYTVGDL
jgi:FkbM family methyltransferase